MAIVEALAADWGVKLLPEGKQVWFRLETPDWAFLAACRCHVDHMEKVMLGSGHHVHAHPGPWDETAS